MEREHDGAINTDGAVSAARASLTATATARAVALTRKAAVRVAGSRAGRGCVSTANRALQWPATATAASLKRESCWRTWIAAASSRTCCHAQVRDTSFTSTANPTRGATAILTATTKSAALAGTSGVGSRAATPRIARAACE